MGLPARVPSGLLHVLNTAPVFNNGERHGSLFSRKCRLSCALRGSLQLLRKVKGACRQGPDERLLNSPGRRP